MSSLFINIFVNRVLSIQLQTTSCRPENTSHLLSSQIYMLEVRGGQPSDQFRDSEKSDQFSVNGFLDGNGH